MTGLCRKTTRRRNGAGSSFSPSASSTASVALPRPLTALAPAAPVQAPATPSSDPTLLEVRAPMLGTYYGAPKPGSEPFITVGGRVDANTAVGIIEVMKLMNSISAGVAGVVVEVLVRDGDLVEFDQVLMRVRPE